MCISYGFENAVSWYDLDLNLCHSDLELKNLSNFGPVLIYRKLDHPMAGIYYIYVLCKHAEI